MEKDKIKDCLIINNSPSFDRRVMKSLIKMFENVDLVEKKNLEGYKLSKRYELIIVNWGLKDLKKEAAETLLRDMREHLTINRKPLRAKGIMIFKEPVIQFDFEVPL